MATGSHALYFTKHMQQILNLPWETFTYVGRRRQMIDRRNMFTVRVTYLTCSPQWHYRRLFSMAAFLSTPFLRERCYLPMAVYLHLQTEEMQHRKLEIRPYWGRKASAIVQLSSEKKLPRMNWQVWKTIITPNWLPQGISLGWDQDNSPSRYVYNE